MKTFVIISVVVLFLLSIYFYFTKCDFSQGECETKCEDKRIDKIRRAKKNLHPTRNSGVDRDSNGRFCKKN